MADIYTGMTVFGLYDNSTESPLFGATGTAVPTSSILVGGSDGVNIQPLSTDSSGRLNVNASSAPPTDSKANATINGDGTGTQFVQVSCEGTSQLQMQVTVAGGYDGTLTFQSSLDGTTWHNFILYPVLPDGTPGVSSTTNAGQWQSPVGGMRLFRAINTPGTTGTATVFLTAGQGQYGVVALSPNAANFNATVVVSGTASTNLTQVGGSAISLGQKTMANSLPVVIASDQSAVPVSGTVTVNQGTSPWVVSGTVTANAGTGTFRTAPDGTIWALTGTSANVDVTNTVTVTGTVAVTQSTSPWVVSGSGNFSVVGTLTNNNAAPAANNVGVLPAVATNAPETYTNGDQVLATTSLGGALRVVPVDEENASSISYFSANTGVTQLSLANATITPVISIETNSASTIFRLIHVDGNSGGTIVQWQLYKNATLTGATFATTISNAKIDTAATSFTGGTVVWSSYSGSNDALADNLLIAMAGGTPGDKFTLAAQKVGTGTSKVLGEIGWREQAAAL